MTIRQRITIAFAAVMAALLLMFSVAIYTADTDYRRTSFLNRLARRAEATRTFLTDRPAFQGMMQLTLTDQYEALFNQTDDIIYSLSGRNDYVPNPAFLAQVRREGHVDFSYKNPQWTAEKEGVALAFRHGGQQYVAIVTAYDSYGHQYGQTLAAILVVGNVLAFCIIGLSGYWLSKRAMRPFDKLLAQLDRTPVDDFSFRLRSAQAADEAGQIAQSFNTLLERLQALAQSQQQFVNYASHEIRTPLTVVKGQLETALAYDTTLTAVQKSVGIALQRLNSAIELANALLRLAEVDGLNSATPWEDINVADLVLSTADVLQQTYPEQGIHVQLTDAFLANSDDLRLSGAAHLLQTAVINLADNACKYANGQPVDLTLDFAPGWVIIQVKDRGIGIPAADLGNVFIPLMRAGNVGTVRGFGLGLTLARRIADHHKGTLTIDSKVGKGTNATLRLPV